MNKIYPFKFLDAYSAKDTSLFFGRDEEINDLYTMIFQSNILMVYGASGTGKTSLIQCGLAGRFQPHDWLALYIRRGSNLNDSFNKVIAEAGGVEGESLEESFKAIYRNSFRPIYLIFDQFEELFILGTKDEQTKFIATVQAIINIEQPVKMIFSIREEYVGHLYDFEKEVPQLMRRKLRVEPMNLDKVGQVIRGAAAFKNSNITLKAREEQAIIESIFEKIRGADKSGAIQLPYLQVFLDKLYMATTHDDTRQAEAVFSMETINTMGNIGDILRDFLEEQVKAISRKLSTDDAPIFVDEIWKILSPFATLEGTKDPISMHTLQVRLPGMDAKLVNDTVQAFVTSRILRHTEEGDIYELAHDSLAGKIADKRSNEEVEKLEVTKLIEDRVNQKVEDRDFFSEKQLIRIDAVSNLDLTPEQSKFISDSRNVIRAEKEKLRRSVRRNYAIMTVVIILLSGLSIWAFRKSNEANQKTTEAQSLALSSQSATEINKNGNYTRAFKFAQYAFEKDPSNPNAIIAIYNTIIQPGNGLVHIFYNDMLWHKNTDTTFVVSADGNKVFYIGPENSLNIVDVNDSNKHIVIPIDSTRDIMAHTGCGWGLSYGLSPDGNILTVKEKYGDKKTYFIDVHSGKNLLYSDARGPGSYVVDKYSDTDEYTNPELNYEETEPVPFFCTRNNTILIGSINLSDSILVKSYSDYKEWKYLFTFHSIGIFDSKSRKFVDSILLANSTDKINSVFSEDGRRLAIYSSARSGNLLQVFSTQTWKKLKEFHVSKNDSLYFAFSNDSKQLAVRCANGPLEIFDASSMNAISLTGPIAARFTSNNKRLIFNHDKNILTLFDFITGNKVIIKPDAAIQGSPDKKDKNIFDNVILSADGKRLLTQWQWNSESVIKASLWDTKTGKKITDIELAKGDNEIQTLGLSPDGKYILTTLNEKATVWNDLGKQVALLSGHKSNITRAAFSKDSKAILTFSGDEFIKKWSLVGISDTPYISTRVSSADFSDFSSIASVDVNGNEYNSHHRYHIRDTKEVTLPGGNKIIAGNQSVKIKENWIGMGLTDHLADTNICLLNVVPSADRQYLFENFVGINDGRSIPPGVERTTDKMNEYYKSLRYSVLWDIVNDRKITFESSKYSNDAVFSPDSRFLLIKSQSLIAPNSLIRLIDVNSLTELTQMNFSSDNEVAFSKDSKMLMVKHVNRKYLNKKDSTINRYQCENCIDISDSTIKAWIIAPEAIINKMNNDMGNLSPSEKAKYGIK